MSQSSLITPRVKGQGSGGGRAGAHEPRGSDRSAAVSSGVAGQARVSEAQAARVARYHRDLREGRSVIAGAGARVAESRSISRLCSVGLCRREGLSSLNDRGANKWMARFPC